METRITIDILCKHIENLKSETDLNVKKIEPIQSHFIPENIKHIFGTFLNNINKISYDKNDNSLIRSIIFSISEDFRSYNTNQQSSYYSILKNKLMDDLDHLYKILNYKSINIKKCELVKYIRDDIFNKVSLKYISDYFNINIFIIDGENQKIYLTGTSNFKIIVHKPSIFLYYNNDEIKPITIFDKFIWNNTLCYNQILNNYLKFIYDIYDNTVDISIIEEDISIYLENPFQNATRYQLFIKDNIIYNEQQNI